MGISALAVAATLSRLSPGARVEDALQALCHEPGLPLEPKDFWECPICFELLETTGWQCREGHRFCRSCMRHHVKVVAFPRCPQLSCGYDLTVADLRLLKVSSKRVEAFEHGKLQAAIETLAYDMSSGTCTENVVHCRKDGCSNVMLVPRSNCRECFACPCGAPPFCTQCGEIPYHFHADCKRIQDLRQRWLTWVSEARTFRKKQAEAYAELQKRMSADRLLLQDEIWKMTHCRLCPKCNRVVEKLDGCNAMQCGQDTHGGNKQAGCGAKFDWTEAAPYTSKGPTPPKPKQLSDQLSKDQGKGVYHPGITCKVCEKGIFGPRLRCIHCESFDVCVDCEAALDNHDLSHVFEVMCKADFDWTTLFLRPGVDVHIVRSRNRLPPRWHGNQFEGRIGTVVGWKARAGTTTYEVNIRGHRGSNPEVPAEHVVPVFESRSQAEINVFGYETSRRTWSQIDKAFKDLVAAEGVLVACRALKSGRLD